MTRDGFIWKEKRAGVCACAEVIHSFLHGRGYMAKKIKPQIRMVPLLLKRQDWDSQSYKGPGSENAEKIGPSLPQTRPERIGSVQGPHLPESPHHEKPRHPGQKPEERLLEMGQEASRWPQGSPSSGP